MAAGPKLIIEEFLRDAKKAQHALGYAPGCDLLDGTGMDNWDFANRRYTELIERFEAILPLLPQGTAEAIREERYGNKS